MLPFGVFYQKMRLWGYLQVAFCLLILRIICLKLKMKKKRLYYERKTIQITLVIIESHGVLIINLYNTNYIRLFSCVDHIRCIIFTRYNIHDFSSCWTSSNTVNTGIKEIREQYNKRIFCLINNQHNYKDFLTKEMHAHNLFLTYTDIREV